MTLPLVSSPHLCSMAASTLTVWAPPTVSEEVQPVSGFMAVHEVAVGFHDVVVQPSLVIPMPETDSASRSSWAYEDV